MIHSLQFFRFVAFFAIFTLHAQCYGWFKYHGTAAMAVSFFIVLSGFLSGVNGADKCAKPGMKEWGEYVWRKICKFYPLHFTLLLVCSLYFKGGVFKVFVDGDPGALRDFVGLFLKNAFLVQSWFDGCYFTFNGVSWFLSTIMFLYICAPWLKWVLVRMCKWRRWLALPFAISFFGLNCLYCHLVGTTEANMEFWVYIFPPSRLPEFAAGMSLGILLSGMVADRTYKPIQSCVMSLLEIGIVWLIIRSVLGRWSLGDWGTRSSNYIVQNLALIGIFSLQRGVISRILENRFSLVLGMLSAPAFLIHHALIGRVSRNFYGLNVDAGQKHVLFFLCLIMTLAFSFMAARKGIWKALGGAVSATGKRNAGLGMHLAVALGCAALVATLAILSPLRKRWETVRIRLSDKQEWDAANCTCIKVFYALPDKPQFDTKRQSVMLDGTPAPGEWYEGYIPLGSSKIRIDFRQEKKASGKDLRYPRIEELWVGSQRHDPAGLKPQTYGNDVDPMFVLDLQRKEIGSFPKTP